MNIASIAPVAARDTKQSSNSTQGVDQTFLQLLATQLQYQSPFDPIDPNQLTTQLVQFNMLDQLTQIRQILQGAAPASSTGSVASSQGAR